MTTIAAPASSPLSRVRVRFSRPMLVAGIGAIWLIGFALFRDTHTLAIAQAETTSLHDSLNDFRDTIARNRNSNPIFVHGLNEIRSAIDQIANFFFDLIAQPSHGRPVPLLGWLGVVVLATFGAWAFGNVKVAALTAGGLAFIGMQGLWQESMDTLALTITAVLLSLAIGIPLGVWAGVSNRVNRVMTPLLDFMQTMPTFVYLAPLTLLFLIGPASAVIATLIYAAPPVIRITAHGIRGVPTNTLEAAESLGSTRGQLLTKVMLPMAKRTIVIGINQTIMAALAMVTIAALIDAPGLGRVVFQALQSTNVGTAFNAGLAIVIIAIVLDRVTTAASVRGELARRKGWTARAVQIRRGALLAGAAVSAVCVYLAYTFTWAAEFPTSPDLGGPIQRGAQSVSDWMKTNLDGITNPSKDFISNEVLNPLQTLLTDSPWWLVAVVIVSIALVIGSVRAAITAAVCLGLLVATGVWSDAMATLAATLLATVMVMVIGVVVGVWMGRNRHADRIIRPLLDAAQVMPHFVYLVPFLALFDATRFTAIVAAVIYAAPVVIKLVADGIAGVSPATVEAATSAGSSTWQIITKVQLPMSLRTLALATNQGLIYVLSMVVVGGLVGAQALGFDVVSGFRQRALFGKGLAAGLAIVLLGIMLDRITQAAARRADVATHHV